MLGRFGQHPSPSWHMCTRFEFPCIAFASLVSRLEEMGETFISAGAGSSSSPLPSAVLTDPSRSRKLGLTSAAHTSFAASRVTQIEVEMQEAPCERRSSDQSSGLAEGQTSSHGLFWVTSC